MKIPLTKPFFNRDELDAVAETLESGWVAGQGPKGTELSEFVQSLLSVKHCIPVNNCTAGLHLALLALRIGPGDEVLVSDYTFPASGHTVMFCGAKPVFVDVNRSTFNLNPELIEAKITSRTKGIMVVHALGQMAELERITEIARKHDLNVIEDAACAMGAKRLDKQAGIYGDISCFSLHARKNATSGEGGLIVTNNDDYANQMRSQSCLGMESAFARQVDFSIPEFTSLGYNYKLSDINAAIALVQIKRNPELISKKRKLVDLYNQELTECEYIEIPFEDPKGFHTYSTYAITLDDKINRNKLILTLRDDGIQAQIGTYASHIQPVYNSDDSCPESLFLYNQSLALPLFYEMTEEQVILVTEKVKLFIKRQLSGE